jgi:hypothetical protein
MAKLDSQRLIFGAFLMIPIILAEVVCGHLKLPAWPAFLAMILFFMEHMNPKKVPEILVGAVFGIACIIFAGIFIKMLAPALGLELARLVFIVVIVYLIVAFGEIVPMVFNNYAFLYLTVAGVAAMAGNPQPIVWMAIALVGGAALIGSVVGIGRLMMGMAARAVK